MSLYHCQRQSLPFSAACVMTTVTTSCSRRDLRLKVSIPGSTSPCMTSGLRRLNSKLHSRQLGVASSPCSWTSQCVLQVRPVQLLLFEQSNRRRNPEVQLLQAEVLVTEPANRSHPRSHRNTAQAPHPATAGQVYESPLLASSKNMSLQIEREKKKKFKNRAVLCVAGWVPTTSLGCDRRNSGA